MINNKLKIVTNENAFSCEYDERWTADVAGIFITETSRIKFVASSFGHTQEQALEK